VERLLDCGEYVNERLLLRLPHRQMVFMPRSGELSRDLHGKERGKHGLRAVTRAALDDTRPAVRFAPEG